MKKNSFFIFILLVFTQACGLKITNEIDDNVLIGSWELSNISCYNNQNESTIFEDYDMTSHNIKFIFDGTSFSYEVNSALCTSTSYGRYSTNFNGTSTGELDLINIISSGTCDVTQSDDGPNSVGVTTITTEVLPSTSDDLFWLVNGDSLEFEFGTGFRGSSNNPGCQGLCFCKGFYTKI